MHHDKPDEGERNLGVTGNIPAKATRTVESDELLPPV